MLALVRMTRRRPYCAGGSSVIPHSLRAYLQSISCEYNSLVEKLAKEDVTIKLSVAVIIVLSRLSLIKTLIASHQRS